MDAESPDDLRMHEQWAALRARLYDTCSREEQRVFDWHNERFAHKTRMLNMIRNRMEASCADR
jgi:hypothetical protein